MPALPHLHRTLQSFTNSPLSIQRLITLPSSLSTPLRPTKTLYILDSSFNPPTLAHLRICTSALLHDRPYDRPKRLLLLLAIQNVDKAPKPATFEQRLAMMSLFARDLVEKVQVEGKVREEDVIVDVGVTKAARFVEKVEVVEREGWYTSSDGGEPVEQVHLVGYDTLVRLLDTKYYPPEHTLKPLAGLFEKHRVRVTRRTDDQWGGGEEQEEYLKKLARGDREAEEGRSEWAGRIELVEGRGEGEDVVSSTRVREAVKSGDREALGKLVSERVRDWMLSENIYLDDEGE